MPFTDTDLFCMLEASVNNIGLIALIELNEILKRI